MRPEAERVLISGCLFFGGSEEVLWFGGCVRRRPDTRRLVGCRSQKERQTNA